MRRILFVADGHVTMSVMAVRELFTTLFAENDVEIIQSGDVLEKARTELVKYKDPEWSAILEPLDSYTIDWYDKPAYNRHVNKFTKTNRQPKQHLHRTRAQLHKQSR